MGERPSPQHKLDRIDNDGGYEPGNCRWVTHRENLRNMSTNVVIEFDGRRMTLVEWSEVIGIPYKTLWQRIRGMKWSAERAFTTPLKVVK
jgi:hypothetical protein